MYKISKKLRSVYYNQDEAVYDNATVDKQWDRYLVTVIVIFECNSSLCAVRRQCSQMGTGRRYRL